jgi:hypothetical protein
MHLLYAKTAIDLYHPRQAYVYWGPTSPQGNTFDCVVMLYVRGSALTFVGEWRSATVRDWGGPVLAAKGKLEPPSSGNSCVRKDGSIYAVGAATAASRCPPVPRAA